MITYLNENNTYVYNPNYENFFPAKISNWVLLRDFNSDGRKDIFTGDVFGIRVFINTSTGATPTWEQFQFYDGTGGESDVVLTQGFTSKVNLQIQFDDLPVISDIDNDGDLDILSIRFPAGGTIEFHKNYSQERYGTFDSLDFKRESTAWGGVRECSCGDFAFNNTDCPDGGRVKHAGGKSMTALDADGDGDQDILFSESSCNMLYLLRNTGTVANPEITSASFFPSGTPANMLSPSAYYEDVDFDGTKDLVVSPNLFVNEFPAAQPDLGKSNWFYKNNGTNAAPLFGLIKENFLQDQGIDVGDNSVPAFADYDNDGDLDLFISHLTSQGFVGTIALYKNTGSQSEPSFALEETDYVSFSGLNLFNIKLQWADINADATTDMVFTATSFFTGSTVLFYVPNQATGAFRFGGSTLETTNFLIARNENLYVADVNNDGALDILLGKSNGALEYWKNSGGVGSFNYVLEDNSYLGLGPSVLRQNLRASTGDLDADGSEDLVIGDQSGKLTIASNFRNSTDLTGASVDIIYNELQEAYSAKNLGGRVWPTVVNLFNSNKPTIVVGNTMGGVYLLRNENDEPLPENPQIWVFPVPAERHLPVYIRTDRPVSAELYSSLGQRVFSGVSITANRQTELPLPPLSSGVYILRVSSGDKTTVKRIVIY